MINSFVVVGTQVLILFILIGLGYLGGKIKITNKEGVKCINDIMLYFVTPCVIIDAFQREFDALLLRNLMLSILAAFISHALCFVLGLLFIKNVDKSKQKVLRFGVIFSNCGFMALPLLNALLGSEGVFYGAGYLGVFNLLCWSIGQYIMAGKENDFNLKKAIINPGVIAVIIGFIFFILAVDLPEIVEKPVGYMASLNTPVAMLIIGYTISTLDLKRLFKIKEAFLAIFFRLILAPLVLLGILYAMNYRGTLLSACIVSASAPIAATTTMLSIKYKGDEILASKIVAVSTVLSIITMTLIVGFAQYISGN